MLILNQAFHLFFATSTFDPVAKSMFSVLIGDSSARRQRLMSALLNGQMANPKPLISPDDLMYALPYVAITEVVRQDI